MKSRLGSRSNERTCLAESAWKSGTWSLLPLFVMPLTRMALTLQPQYCPINHLMPWSAPQKKRAHRHKTTKSLCPLTNSCVGERFVRRHHLLIAEYTMLLLVLGEVESSKNCLKLMKNERKKMKMRKKEAKRNAHFMHGWDDTNTRTSWAMRCVQGMSVTAETKQALRRLTLRAHSLVHQMCHIIVGFHVLCVDVSFHVVIGVGRLAVQQEGFLRQLHFTTHTQFQVQSYFLLDVVVRLCPVIVNSNCVPNSCMFHIAKTGPLRSCLYTPRRLQ